MILFKIPTWVIISYNYYVYRMSTIIAFVATLMCKWKKEKKNRVSFITGATYAFKSKTLLFMCICHSIIAAYATPILISILLKSCCCCCFFPRVLPYLTSIQQFMPSNNIAEHSELFLLVLFPCSVHTRICIKSWKGKKSISIWNSKCRFFFFFW